MGIVRLIRQPAADVVGSNCAVFIAQGEDEIAVIKRPGRVAVDHDHGFGLPFVQVVAPMAVYGKIVSGKRIELLHHSNPSIKQLSPLPIPRKPTRFPVSRNPYSSASAAVKGSDTVPMLPR